MEYFSRTFHSLPAGTGIFDLFIYYQLSIHDLVVVIFTRLVMMVWQPTILETRLNIVELAALSLQKRTMFLNRDLQQTADMHTTKLNEEFSQFSSKKNRFHITS